MRRHFYPPFQKVIVCIVGLLMLLFVTACTGVSSVGPNLSAPGTVGPGTPNSNGSQGTPVPGSISFIGPVQSVNSSSIVVKMPNGQLLTASIVNGQTDLSNFNGGLPSQGQTIQITVTANTSGSFTATELKAPDSGDAVDQTLVTYDGVVTSTVGSDKVIHFRVGSQDFSFTLNASTDLTDFQNNSQSIGNNQSIEVEVQFQGTTATVIKVSVQNDQNDQTGSQNG